MRPVASFSVLGRDLVLFSYINKLLWNKYIISDESLCSMTDRFLLTDFCHNANVYTMIKFSSKNYTDNEN